MWDDSVFSTPEYQAFAEQVRNVCATPQDDPLSVQIEKTQGLVAERLRTLGGVVAVEGQMTRHLVDGVRTDFDGRLRALERAIVAFSSGRVTTTTIWNPGLPSSLDHLQETPPLCPPSLCPSPLPLYPPTDSSSSRPTILGGRSQQTSPLKASISERPPVVYKLPRDVSSVFGLWELWKEGCNSMPAVVVLEERWGSAWRKGDSEYFSTRRTIVEEVERRAVAQGKPEREVAAAMDAERGQGTLNQLYKLIRRSLNKK